MVFVDLAEFGRTQPEKNENCSPAPNRKKWNYTGDNNEYRIKGIYN